MLPTWSIVIATYKREHILPQTLFFAAQSTCAPKQIIVVDASPGWNQMRERVLYKIAVQFPAIEWIYEKATTASLTHQRNQGAKLSTSDVIIFIDDDSLMYPDCAEEIMRIFQRDTGEKVTAVGAMLVVEPPDGAKSEMTIGPSSIQMHGDVPTQSRFKKSLRRLVEGNREYLLPYDGDWPKHSIPSELNGLPIAPAKTLHGCLMSVRRSIAIKEPFESILLRYAYLEDSDMTYRASRHGLVLRCISARLCHLGIFGGRMPPYVTALLGALNPAVLHSIYGTDKTRSKEQLRRQMRRRMMFMALKDIQARRLTFPSVRGVYEAIHNLDTVMSKSELEIREWYPRFQKALFERHNCD